MAAAHELATAIRGTGARCTDTTTARAAVKALREARYHGAAMHVADAAFESGAEDLKLRVLYAQSLIDTGRLAAALPILESIGENDPAYGEARGSIGRVFKQWYVNGGGDAQLRGDYFAKAFEAYHGYFTSNGNTWHGINAVALAALARRSGLQGRDVGDLAQPVFDRMLVVTSGGSADAWDFATAGEAAVALGKYDEAKRFYGEFATRPDVSAFALNSALRQLQEVWGLTDDRDPGSSLLPMLRVEMLSRSGGEVELAPGEIGREVERAGDSRLQATFGDECAVPFPWYRRGLERCFSVCRIEDDYDRPKGSGFVVCGGDFVPQLGNRLCILTNDHVVGEHDPLAIPPDKAVARFHALDGSPSALIDEVLWRSGRAELDAVLLSVVDDAIPKSVAPYPFAKRGLDRGQQQKIYVIGHPQGGALSISLYDNLLLDCNETFVHYRSPTQRGSSGSPVFNKDWELVALHHAGDAETRKLDGSGTYQANEGIQIEKIRAKAKLSS